mmetsp:Transcript_20012/g.29028  ORF Transcript_20012/g.29028 Transcript_20012/m.29028 type:complete len:926 (+) Transcript_20012:122-2899(+)
MTTTSSDMCGPTDDPPRKSCGDKVDSTIHSFFNRVGVICASKAKITIAVSLALAALLGSGISQIKPESRPEKLWVPQNTQHQNEEEMYISYFPPTSRFNTMLVRDTKGKNVLTKEHLVSAMELHGMIETEEIDTTDIEDYEGKKELFTFPDLCSAGGGSCVAYNPTDPICNCLVISVLRMWNYDLDMLQADDDLLSTLMRYGSREDLEGVLGNPVFDNNGMLQSAEAIQVTYFLADRSEVRNGNEVDPINEAWEEKVFLESVQDNEPSKSNIDVSYISTRSFSDEFGGAISGDLVFVQVSYIVAFIFLGATLGSRIACGKGSRWAMSFAALILVAASTAAGIGLSSFVGLIYGPVHSLLPFILLGIGVDDSFVIANAFDRERKVSRSSENDDGIIARAGRALGRAGASITVTSATDLVAFAISSSSSLPALSSFCAYASIGIFFLWAFSATFFTACMFIDEKRQRDNRRDCLCCVKRSDDNEEEDDLDKGAKEGRISTYFRKYHAPAILSKPGKAVVLLVFSALFGYGIYGAINLPVEDSERNFIPSGSYINDYIDLADEYFPSSGVSLSINFENGQDIYDKRVELANLSERLTGLSTAAPYIAEPNSESSYQNAMTGLHDFLASSGSAAVGGVTLGDDNWPTSYEDFVLTMKNYTSFTGPGRVYGRDFSYSEDRSSIRLYKVDLEYVRLTKENRGEVIADAARQIDAMDETRAMVESWDDLPSAFVFCEQYLSIEGFKVIQQELYQNVGLAIACVAVIVLITVGNFMAALLITINVALCIVEILGFMFAAGIVIDSVSVINIVLAVGLSVDYSAHIGHSFLVKGGSNKDIRATEALADIGASVLNGAMSTFLAVAVLLGSSSYVFRTLSIQFVLTVVLGSMHGIVLLPVLLSLVGPAPFASAEAPRTEVVDDLELSEDKMENEE